MKGRAAERRRNTWTRSLFRYLRTVTPASHDHKGKSTNNWAKIHAFNILVDPYIASNPRGERYPSDCMVYPAIPVVLAVKDSLEASCFMDLMKAAVAANFQDTDRYKFVFVYDADSAKKASKGEYRSRTAGDEVPVSLLFQDDDAISLDELSR